MALQDIYYHNTTGSPQTLDDGILVAGSGVILLTDYITHTDLMASNLVFGYINAGSAVLSYDGVSTLSQAESLVAQNAAVSLISLTSVPVGGAEGAILYKASVTDLDTAWSGLKIIGGGDSLELQGEVRFLESPGNGSAYVGFKSPSSLTSNQIWVLPIEDGDNKQVVSTDGSGNLSFSTIVEPSLSTNSIDATTTSTTQIYTGPVGEKWVLKHIVFELTNVVSISGDLKVEAGAAGSTNNIMPSTRLRGFNTETEVYVHVVEGNTRVVNAGEAVDLKITTAFSGTSADIKVSLFGYKLG